MKKILLITLLGCITHFGLQAQYSATTIKTPNNVSIDAGIFTGTDFNSTEAAGWDAYWKGSWDVEILSTSTQTYNCHGYAWHKVDGGGTYWVNDIDEITLLPNNNVRTKYYIGSTPSYVESTSNYRAGLKVSYYPRDHSAVTTSTPNEVLSKWAWGPFVRHNINETDFYSGATIKFYEVPITGNTLLCSSPSQTYSTLNISGASYSWSGSNVSASSSTYSVSASATSSGTTGTVDVSISSPYSGTTVVSRKDIWVGSPRFTLSVDGINTNSANVTAGSWHSLNAAPHGSGTSFSYTDYSGSGDMSISLTPTGGYAYLNVGSGSTSGHREVIVGSSNSCGSYNEYLYLYLASFRMMVYPNPAKNYVTIQFEKQNIDSMPDQIIIYSERSAQPIKTVRISEFARDAISGKGSLTIDTQNWPRGSYFINVIPKENSPLKPEKLRVLLD
jgi:hypothetical protein